MSETHDKFESGCDFELDGPDKMSDLPIEDRLSAWMAWAYGHGDELALVVKGVIYGAVVFGVHASARTRSGAGVAWAAAAVLALVVAYTAVGLVIA